MMPALDPFFIYACDRCGAPFCERVQIMNLALDYVDEQYCLACLATEQEMGQPEIAAFAKDYVHARECFKTPWDNVNAAACPRIEQHQCFCQDP
jgi:hypothetical protein